ncbi:hypothetical protein [Flavisphingomonas formosensis]|uniref:hypothetical protein n=1 Tax=Flavisphingomonas formosensis TaxID=861534 RepID=UPI0012FC9715|nr:hypothetical protein [Sphingomonas formosensis]
MSLGAILKRMSIMLKTAAIILFALSAADLVHDHVRPQQPNHVVIGPLGLVGVQGGHAPLTAHLPSLFGRPGLFLRAGR